MNKGTKLAIAGTVAVLLCGGSYAVVDAAGLLKKSGPLSDDEIHSVAQEFLGAWGDGNVDTAADLTDDSAAASDALARFWRELGPEMSAQVVREDTAKVDFRVTLRVKHDNAGSVWAYDSSLRTVRDQETGEPRVVWSPTVVHPGLTRKGDALDIVEASGLSIQATDRDGTKLTAEEFPSLAAVLPDLGKRYGEKLGGRPGVEVRVTRRDGTAGPSLHTVSRGKPATLRTTLSAGLQRAAERAVKKYPQSSAVAVEPSSGEILAVANNRTDGFNAAFLGGRAPGSTMKIVTTAALLEKGLVEAAKPAPCPKFASYEGATFHNLDKFTIENGTFSDAFIRSCNTTFIGFADDIDGDTLTREAKEVFGLGLEWRSGVATFDGSVPQAEGGEKAAGMIGQGKVQANALNMASVAATAVTGQFRQPVLVSPDLDGREIAETDRSLPDDVAGQLRDMMRRTATQGTAAEALSGLTGDVGAKTGSAEVGGEEVSDSWFTGFRDDVAAAAMVEAGGHGGDAAGPVVRDILAAGK
ncbi:penicillin-binding transpeptidase domain-containing protein [Streptomyces sp. NPDC094143]|uniref:penicillin-binding transpeptidase domain-containing protein n=1 Tax=Streptomyces sp. NPDC094143 TaxID=3155310 RepID=UPI003324EB73